MLICCILKYAFTPRKHLCLFTEKEKTHLCSFVFINSSTFSKSKERKNERKKKTEIASFSLPTLTRLVQKEQSSQKKGNQDTFFAKAVAEMKINPNSNVNFLFKNQKRNNKLAVYLYYLDAHRVIIRITSFIERETHGFVPVNGNTV